MVGWCEGDIIARRDEKIISFLRAKNKMVIHIGSFYKKHAKRYIAIVLGDFFGDKEAELIGMLNLDIFECFDIIEPVSERYYSSKNGKATPSYDVPNDVDFVEENVAFEEKYYSSQKNEKLNVFIDSKEAEEIMSNKNNKKVAKVVPKKKSKKLLVEKKEIEYSEFEFLDI